MKNRLKYAGNIISFVSLFFILIKLVSGFNNIPALEVNVQTVAVASGYVLFVSIGPCIHAYLWKLMLESYSVNISFNNSLYVLGRSQIAKYIPGNVFQYLGRIALGNNVGISVDVAVKSIIAENIFVLLSAAVIVMIGFLLDTDDIIPLIYGIKIGYVSLIVASVLFVVITVNNAFRLRLYESVTCIKKMKVGTVLLIISTWSIIILVLGIFQCLIIKYFWNLSIKLEWYKIVWRYVFAWLMGYIIPGSPGGIGVRDSLFFLSVKGQIDEPIALGITIASRLLTIIGDICSYVMLLILYRKRDESHT
jgi:hypothetical protein